MKNLLMGTWPETGAAKLRSLQAGQRPITDMSGARAYPFASDATASISISIFGLGSACTTQVVRAG
jgi:hypothetical protein